MVTPLFPAERELKITQALVLLKEGLGPTEVGRRVGAAKQTIEEWRKRYWKLVCKRCGEEMAKPQPTDICPFCAGELREKAIGTLIAHRGGGDFELAQRAKAISILRDLGYSQQEALQIRARVVDGHSIEEIVGWLCGEEREAVAA